MNIKKSILLPLFIASSLFAQEEPFLGLSLNLPRVLEFMTAEASPEEQQDPQFQIMTGALKMLGEGHVDVLLYTSEEHGALPVLTMPHGQEALTEAIDNGPLNAFFVKDGAGYKINPELAEEEADAKEGIPMDQYTLKFVGGSAIFAPEPLHAALAEQQIQPFTAAAAGEQGLIRISQNLVTLAINFPEELDEGLAEEVAGNELGQALPQAEMATELGSTLIDMLFESLDKIESFRVGFVFGGEDGRKLNYLQTFRDVAEGQKIYEAMKAKSLEPGEEVLAGILATMNSEGFTSRSGYKDGKLLLQTSWTQDQDGVIAANVIKVVMGSMMGIGTTAPTETDIAASEGEIVTEYENKPIQYGDQSSFEELKSGLAVAAKAKSFAGKYWDFGSEPHMSVDLDPMNLPNIGLFKGTYEVIAVKAPDDTDVFRPGKQTFNTLSFWNHQSQNLRIPVKKDTPAEQLGTATIKFNLTGPETVTVFDFDQAGQSLTRNGITVTLKKMERDVAAVSCKGAKGVKMVGYDKTGRMLRWRESRGGISNHDMRSWGELAKVRVVAEGKESSFSATAEIDLNGGKRYELPEEPADDVRVRYHTSGVRFFNNIDDASIDALKAEWVPSEEAEYEPQKLVIALPPGVHWKSEMEAFFFGEKEAAQFNEQRPHRYDSIVIGVEQRRNAPPPDVRAVFGQAKLTFSRGLEQLRFDKQADGEVMKQTSSAGHAYEVTIDRNQAKVKGEQILQLAFCDKEGRVLKTENKRWGNSGKRATAWGQIDHVLIEVFTEVTEKVIDFDLSIGEYDEAAYAAFKKQIDKSRVVTGIIKELRAAGQKNRAGYGTCLAGLHYIHNKPKGGAAMNLISQDLAHSDPQGAELFGYEAKPYKGYHFFFFKGTTRDGKQKNRLENQRVQDFAWEQGSIQGHRRAGQLEIIANPVDPADPVFFTDGSTIHYKVLPDGKLEYTPDSSEQREWPIARFID